MNDELKQLAEEGMPLVLQDLDTGAAEIVDPVQLGVVSATLVKPQGTGQMDLFAGEGYEVPTHHMQPSGDVFRGVFKVQSLGEKIEDKDALATMQKRRQSISHSAAVAVSRNKQNFVVTFSKSSEKTTVTVDNLKALCGKNTGTMRIFKLITGEITKHCIINGMLVNKYLTIDRRLLTDLNIYKNQDTALKGWKEAMKKLNSIKVSAEGKNKFAVATLFPTLDFDSKHLVVVLNDTLNWGNLIKGLAYTPTWILDQKLDINTFVMADFIYDQIRIKKEELVIFKKAADGTPEAAYIDMKLVNLQEVMNLPSCEAAKSNASRLVKKPIVDAVADFNAAADKVEDSQVKLAITPSTSASPKDSTQQWLDHNGLRVFIQGRLLEELLKLVDKHTLRIEEQVKRKTEKMAKSC